MLIELILYAILLVFIVCEVLLPLIEEQPLFPHFTNDEQKTKDEWDRIEAEKRKKKED